ncbi:MAG TPA: hypothetical protein VJN93_13560 [Candidatus Acidoferrum sp.]|nr:hypothetical protein [Candidatus Acidoferrum sp.]
MIVMDHNGGMSEVRVAGENAAPASRHVAKTVSPEMQGLLDAIALLKKVVEEKLGQLSDPRPSGKFQPAGIEKADAARAELQKALANGKPVASQPTSTEGASPRFQTCESVGPGQRVFHGSLSTNVAEKTDAADAALHKALANGKPAEHFFAE